MKLLETQIFSASELSKQTALSYSVVMYHLRLLKNEGIVEHKGSKRYFWLITGLGQKRLN
ncbi:MAG: helix-turn-helix transcriptional regulator [Candidatus Bathyarchaeota archaeon]|nr:helix-turn-helix domain-containing protein [Thermoproteota archaeon]MDT8781794.1 helix-turn-helix transcriptional regulator [Candidatus Bathyarchaeota archaeon]NLD65300.1 helix-turn-helix transcriptional regulator [Thermoproteota archaeon]